MKRFFVLLGAAVVISLGYKAIAENVGSGNLLFYKNSDGTILTPVLEVDGTPYGYYNLAGEPINEDGSSRSATLPPGVTDQQEIADAIGSQYAYSESENGIIVITTN